MFRRNCMSSHRRDEKTKMMKTGFLSGRARRPRYRETDLAELVLSIDPIRLGTASWKRFLTTNQIHREDLTPERIIPEIVQGL